MFSFFSNRATSEVWDTTEKDLVWFKWYKPCTYMFHVSVWVTSAVFCMPAKWKALMNCLCLDFLRFGRHMGLKLTSVSAERNSFVSVVWTIGRDQVKAAGWNWTSFTSTCWFTVELLLLCPSHQGLSDMEPLTDQHETTDPQLKMILDQNCPKRAQITKNSG